MFGSHEHDAVISEVKLKPSAGMRRPVRKEPRTARIVNLEVSSGLLSESVAVIEAYVYRPGWYPVRMRRNSDPDCFSIVKSYDGFASKLEDHDKVPLLLVDNQVHLI